MRIVCISDTHSLHESMLYKVEEYIDPNQVNVLIHAGDITNIGQEHDVRNFVEWFQNLQGFESKIFIAGNHELTFEEKQAWVMNYINEENLSQSDCVYLEDSEFIMTLPEFSKPIKFYGSPWTPPFFNWAFMADETKIKKKWKLIPKDTDILITHGPAQGILDIIKMKSVGCQHLRERIEKINPCLHVSGHIHFSNGVAMVKDTIYVNASICTEKYKPHQKPKVVDIIEVNKKLVAEWKDI